MHVLVVHETVHHCTRKRTDLEDLTTLRVRVYVWLWLWLCDYALESLTVGDGQEFGTAV